MRIGQSTLKQALISWLAYAGIDFSAVDADPVHKTLSSWYPDFTARIPFRTEEDLLGILNVPVAAPVHLIDFPSMQSESILKAFEHFNAAKVFESNSIRLTVFIFASDERAAMNSAHQIVTGLDTTADYVVVKNPARFPSAIFENSKPAAMLKKLNAPTIEIPRITGITYGNLGRCQPKSEESADLS